MVEKLSVSMKCECGAEIMEVNYDEDDKSFCFTQFRYMPLRYGFRRRLKFLFTGRVSFNEIYLDSNSAKVIANYINSNIKNNEQ